MLRPDTFDPPFDPPIHDSEREGLDLRASARGIIRDGNIPWARVFDLGGKRLFDSGPVMGNALDQGITILESMEV